MTDHPEPTEDQLDPTLAAVISERRTLISLAYRLLGSLSDAEDAVQETYARWYAMSPDQQGTIDAPGAWLTTVCSRICLDVLGSARMRRERYVGEWVPEPVPGESAWTSGAVTDWATDPADRVTLDESITMAFMVVLESMSPAERVAFVLHDVFRYSYADIADVVGRTPAACRQLASRARRRLERAGAPTIDAVRLPALVTQFKEAWEAQDIEALVELLDPDATAVADGGGRVSVVPEPVVGGRQIAQVFVDLIGRVSDLTVHLRTVNGQPGLVVKQGVETAAVVAFGLTGDRISHIWAIRNPEKLRAWSEG
jgi:RNA polymerase sigma-70 factor (ECF subfamily)